MNEFKDLFMSYGRRESLGLVGRLHQQLKLAGYDAWFDKVNIPDGDDYAQRINHGIESAHNFVYVMAPRCLTSPYCLMELEYARLLGKRVIPINQMANNIPEKKLPEGNKQALIGFYKSYNLPDQNIRTTQDVFNRSRVLIGKSDWLAGQEKMSDDDCQRLVEWAQPYENNWANHENLDYLKLFKFPIFGQSIDALDGVVERITAVLERQKPYVHRHTEILTDALHWEKNQKATQHLLVGKERTAAEEWLLTEFLPPKQPPCQPTKLLCEYICEARKNAENLMTDIFICYDVDHDKDIRDNVIQSLSRYAKTTWTHDRDIQKGADYECEIEMGIENADNFFYFISPHSITSEYCKKELAHALKYNKRIVPLLIAPTPEPDIPKVLRKLQHVDFTDNTCQADYESDIDDILNILRLAHKYYEQHKVLLARALKWESENHQSSFLLRGHNLENAKTWLRLNDKREQHPPLALHKELITTSEAAKGQLGTEVFVSYSRKDADFARQLNTALQEAGKTTWFDQESISTGVDFENEIFKGISSADNFLFVISKDAVESEYCEREVNYASEQSKRFISVLHRETDPALMPEALRVINWIDFKNTAFDKSFHELIRAIELDREHAHQHTLWQQRAIEWVENNHSKYFLLNITTCKKAEQWRDKANKKQPPITAVQEEFIRQSRVAIKKTSRKRAFVVGAIIFIIAVFAFVQIKKAQENEPELTESKFAELLANSKKAEEEAIRKKAEEEAARKKAEEEEMVRYKAIAKKNAEFQALVEAGKAFRDKLDDGSLGPKMVLIPAGNFKMGDIQGAGDDDEKPVHEVTIKEPFAIGRYEVTFAEYDKFAEAKDGIENPDDEGWGRGNRPVINVSWNDAVEYAKWLSEQTGEKYGLPSEAEWEYAAHAGTETKYWWGNEIGENWANCDGSCGDTFEYTSPVGSFGANSFGLFDTSGNVWEWVADGWHGDYTNAPNDGRVWAEGADESVRVLRGGSWSSLSDYFRTAFRFRNFPVVRYNNLGFRVVCRVVARIN